jgi:hypothetical protein
VLGSDLDLSAAQEAVVTKVGVDATAKPFRRDFPPERKIPEEIMSRINLREYVPNFEEVT